jgi:dienelactone hydrolase
VGFRDDKGGVSRRPAHVRRGRPRTRLTRRGKVVLWIAGGLAAVALLAAVTLTTMSNTAATSTATTVHAVTTGHTSTTAHTTTTVHRSTTTTPAKPTTSRAPPTTVARSTTTRAPGTTAPGGSTTTTTKPAGPPYQVTTQTLHFVDNSRDTEYSDGSTSSGRVLDTVVYKPEGAPGALPVVIFAHGWSSDPGVYDTLLSTWAAAGYLVAAPVFPDNSDLVTSDPVTDFGAQAKDLSFVLTQILNGVAGPVDPKRVAAAGHSDGGSDVAVLALDPNYTDSRFKAYLSLSSEIPDFALDGPWTANPAGSLLVAVGSYDDYGLQPSSDAVFNTSAMPSRVLLTVDGGDHLYMYVGSSDEAAALRRDTVTFLNAALATRTPTSTQLAADLTPTGDPSISVTNASTTAEP